MHNRKTPFTLPSALMYAAFRGNKDIVEFLIQKGTDVKARNNAGWSASMLAEEKGHKDVAEFLKQYERGIKENGTHLTLTPKGR